jgi:hypothetical protein
MEDARSRSRVAKNTDGFVERITGAVAVLARASAIGASRRHASASATEYDPPSSGLTTLSAGSAGEFQREEGL